MKLHIALATVGLAAVLAPSALATPAPGLTLTLDGVFNSTLTAANFGTPVYDYTYTGSPIVVGGTISNGPANGSVNGTSFVADPFTPAASDMFASVVPVSLDGTGSYGPTSLANIPVDPNTLDPNNLAFYTVTGGVDINDNSMSATDGIHIVSTAVPEPGSVAMLAGMVGSGALLLRRRK